MVHVDLRRRIHVKSVSLFQSLEEVCQDQVFQRSHDLVKLLGYWRRLWFTDLSQSFILTLPSLTVVTDTSKKAKGFSLHEVRRRWGLASHLHSPLQPLRDADSFFLAHKAFSRVHGEYHRFSPVGQYNHGSLFVKGRFCSSPSLNSLTLKVWSLARARGWHVRVVYLRGVLNTRADTLSRSKPIQTEWTLDRASFQWLSRLTSIPPPKSTCAPRRRTKDCQLLWLRLR